MNCTFGDMAVLVRNTTGCPCTQGDLGRVLVARLLLVTANGPTWAMPNGPELCPHCWGPRIGYLDADLQPIRGGGAPVEQVERRWVVAA